MVRFRGHGLLVFLAVIFLGGCASSQKAPDQATDAVPAVADGLPPDSSAVNPFDSTSSKQGGTGASKNVSSPSGSTSSTGLQDYKIVKGDTLMKIAYHSLGDISRWKEIYQNNKDKLPNPNAIPEGVVIQVDRSNPPATLEGEIYLIQRGDTLGKISNQLYGTPVRWKELYEKNKQLIHDPNKIFAGFDLYYSPDHSSQVLGSSTDSGTSPEVGSPALPGTPLPTLPGTSLPSLSKEATPGSAQLMTIQAAAPTTQEQNPGLSLPGSAPQSQ